MFLCQIHTGSELHRPRLLIHLFSPAWQMHFYNKTVRTDSSYERQKQKKIKMRLYFESLAKELVKVLKKKAQHSRKKKKL